MKLSLEEKVELVIGKGNWHTSDLNGKINRVCMSDGPHGIRKSTKGEIELHDSLEATCFPTASAVAASYDTELIRQMGEALADEATQKGVSLLLGPGINIKRTSLCGRNFEYFSEDPYLSGKLAASYIKGLKEGGVGACVKHFAVNNQEKKRMISNSIVDERALREIYLKAFQIAVTEGKPAAVMASYNKINGTYACENKKLLTDILRGEWGFDGAVISDWGAAVDLPKCIEGGMDLEMPESTNGHKQALTTAIKKNKVSSTAVDRAVAAVLKLQENYPMKEAVETETNHHETARRIETESAVLLKNNGILPLDENGKVLIIGDLSENVRYQGSGSSHVNTSNVSSLVEVMVNKGLDVDYVRGYDAKKTTPDKKLESEALEAVVLAYLEHRRIIFVGGLPEESESEGFDREHFNLPDNQRSLIERILKVTNEIVVLSISGSPYNMFFADSVAAILQMYLGGEAVMEAAGDLLLGHENPSGRLAETWSYTGDDVPAYPTFSRDDKNIVYKESVFVGYRYYNTFSVPVRYPFGYGLSYTEFEYEELTANATPQGIEVSVVVKNTGKNNGKVVTEVYVKNPSCDFLRPKRELRGFQKVFLLSGESERLTILIPTKELAIYDTEKKKYVVPAGDYVVEIGKSVENIVTSKTVTVEGESVKIDDRSNLPSYFPKKGVRFCPTQEDFCKLFGDKIENALIQNEEYSMKSSFRELQEVSGFARIINRVLRIAMFFMFFGKSKNSPEVRVVESALMDATIDCVVNQGGGAFKQSWAEKMIKEANKKRNRR